MNVISYNSGTLPEHCVRRRTFDLHSIPLRAFPRQYQERARPAVSDWIDSRTWYSIHTDRNPRGRAGDVFSQKRAEYRSVEESSWRRRNWQCRRCRRLHGMEVWRARTSKIMEANRLVSRRSRIKLASKGQGSTLPVGPSVS